MYLEGSRVRNSDIAGYVERERRTEPIETSRYLSVANRA
jgi:hypothetical protein